MADLVIPPPIGHQEAIVRPPGDPGVWIFIILDMCAFALFFLVFVASRAANPELYEASREQLDVRYGLVNTLILLTSGAFMAGAVASARKGDRKRTLRALFLTLLVGLGFAATKIFEYWTKIKSGITIATNEFFTFYFALTGIHFLHFVIGLGVIVACIAKTRHEEMGASYIRWIESSGCYWHMVDLLWLMLFPLLYLMRTGAVA